MKIIVAIGLGSFIGGVGRYLLSQLIQVKGAVAFPIGTLGVNLLGCFLIGVVFGLAEKGNLSQEWRLFLATGVLGGFTTFSAFSYETVSLLRAGQFGYAVTYVAASILLGLLLTLAGMTFPKLF
ncbi:fluoride efflux transporter CrcB [Nibribacter ruber]|uniref:Fluoride-specific ion channel FluC n=1 Tax=Nibribacter ruber TaxID=2698458 RepID=A0A6P1P3Z2_9BACT|nr:fluoride efflux transporter CrcB [Nibribacter ruber]QHL89149.1 fluoride efflux transporter CrcB [Nibribacter ruber]